jgi:hypothetical protein
MRRIGALMGAVFIAMTGIGMAAGNANAVGANADPRAVVQAYLAGLRNGNVSTLHGLLGPRTKRRSERLLTKNTEYPAFLRAHYAGVVMTIVDITPAGDDYEARVRFDYPTSQSVIRIFTLSLVGGQWSIVGERLP